VKLISIAQTAFALGSWGPVVPIQFEPPIDLAAAASPD